MNAACYCTSASMFLHMKDISFVAHSYHRILSSAYCQTIYALRFSGPLDQDFIYENWMCVASETEIKAMANEEASKASSLYSSFK